MGAMLRLSRAIDGMSQWIGRYAIWLILGSTVISGINALVRKIFDVGSNAYLEIQWYLFAASFLIAAGYTLMNNEHVKIDVVYSRFSRRTQVWIDVFGFIFFLIPLCVTVLRLSIPFAYNGFVSHEMSSNAGGLVRWPVYFMIPLGFTLLLLQALSELIKRLAFQQGLIADPCDKGNENAAEEDLAQAIRQLAEDKTGQA